MGIRHISRDENCEKLFFRGFFRQNLGVWPPVVLRERVISWVFCTFCKWCNTYFKNNLHLSWFFIIRLVKMPKNTQNLTKKPKSQVFSLFQDPLGDKPKVRKFSKKIFFTHLGVFLLNDSWNMEFWWNLVFQHDI